MNWVDILLSTITSSSIIAVTLLILGFFGKKLFEQLLLKDVESHKQKLESQTEFFRTKLEQSAFEHNIRFEKLHNKRADVIFEVYCQIVEAEKKVSSLVRPMQFAGEPELSEKYSIAYDAGKELHDYFSCNRKYSRNELCNEIDGFINRLKDVLQDFRRVVDAIERNEQHRQRLERWQNTWEALQEDLPPIKSDIEEEFRCLLGIEDAS